MALSKITGKYPGCCGHLKYNSSRIRYRDGHMNITSKPLNPTTKSLWTYPVFVFGLKWDLWMSLYVVSPSNFVRKGIGKEDLMSVAFNMVLNNNFLWQSLLVISTQ